jgi:hypothetical protein
LDILVYLHLAFASSSILEHYEDNYDGEAAILLLGLACRNLTSLPTLVFQWLLRSITKLTIIIDHTEESFASRLRGSMWTLERGQGSEDCMKYGGTVSGPLQVAGMFALASLASLLLPTRMEYIIYSVNYPF